MIVPQQGEGADSSFVVQTDGPGQDSAFCSVPRWSPHSRVCPNISRLVALRLATGTWPTLVSFLSCDKRSESRSLQAVSLFLNSRDLIESCHLLADSFAPCSSIINYVALLISSLLLYVAPEASLLRRHLPKTPVKFYLTALKTLGHSKLRVS